MSGKSYPYIVDRAARISPQHESGSQPIVCISSKLFNDLPDGTTLYGRSGTRYYKGYGEMHAWQQTGRHPELGVTIAGMTNFGFLATQEDLRQPQDFTGPYRES